jgi:hypothetical protein
MSRKKTKKTIFIYFFYKLQNLTTSLFIKMHENKLKKSVKKFEKKETPRRIRGA